MNVVNSKSIFDEVSFKCSQVCTNRYSTSFSVGIKLFDRSIRDAIYSIYAFVRLADEIVDSFHDFDKKNLLDRFESDMYRAVEERISLNPVLNSFQHTVNTYKIDHELIDKFLQSMRMDLRITTFDSMTGKKYVHGSAEVVGLMCLRVFCGNDERLYKSLQQSALKLGSAFQKVNFLRDLNSDLTTLKRAYFPGCDLENFTDSEKAKIENEILIEFLEAYEGVKRLPRNARMGVLVAYVYYFTLFKKIQRTSANKIMNTRIRIPNLQKAMLIFHTMLIHQLKMS